VRQQKTQKSADRTVSGPTRDAFVGSSVVVVTVFAVFCCKERFLNFDNKKLVEIVLSDIFCFITEYKSIVEHHEVTSSI
jgi:hypothetical protein